MSRQVHLRRRADQVVAHLRDLIGTWQGEGYAAHDVHWHRVGIPGVSEGARALSVAEAETLARLLAEQVRTAPE